MFWLLLLSQPARAYNNGMGATPPMGWNSWCTKSVCNLVGLDPCSERMVRSVADAMVDEGLRAAGYEYVNLDDCWSARTRDADGNLQPEPRMFPNGMKAVADYVHDRGLKLGLYTCAGTETCKGGRPGSFGNYQRDARTLEGWGARPSGDSVATSSRGSRPRRGVPRGYSEGKSTVASGRRRAASSGRDRRPQASTS